MSDRHESPSVFTSGAGVAFYTAAAFGLAIHFGLSSALACIIAAGIGLATAAIAAKLAGGSEREQRSQPRSDAPETAVADEPEAKPPAPTTASRGFAKVETREQRTSREMQAALLPRELPAIVGYHADVHYEPCGALGGDFYDCMPCEDGRILFTLGDVSGKGPASAIVMAMVQTLFRENLRDAKGPADLLARVNTGFAGAIGKGVFVTAQAAILDPARHRLTLAAAGHPPVLLLNAGLRRASEVRAQGRALGILGGNCFADSLAETSIDLAPGDSLLFYTDGAVESADDIARGGGEGRLLAAAASSVVDGPDGALQRLREDLWSGGGRRDDTTLLLVTRRSPLVSPRSSSGVSSGELKV
ncbi:MAG: PP2C family protein-serine/threonine phosphatase [Planctomycetota bacterium]